MHGKGLQSALARSNARVWARNKLTMVKQAQAALEDGAGGGCEVRIVRVLEDPHGKLHALLPQLWRGGRAVQACGDGLRGVERGTVSGSLDTPHAVEAGSSAHLERVRKVVCSGYALAEQAQQARAHGSAGRRTARVLCQSLVLRCPVEEGKEALDQRWMGGEARGPRRWGQAADGPAALRPLA